MKRPDLVRETMCRRRSSTIFFFCDRFSDTAVCVTPFPFESERESERERERERDRERARHMRSLPVSGSVFTRRCGRRLLPMDCLWLYGACNKYGPLSSDSSSTSRVRDAKQCCTPSVLCRWLVVVGRTSLTTCVLCGSFSFRRRPTIFIFSTSRVFLTIFAVEWPNCLAAHSVQRLRIAWTPALSDVLNPSHVGYGISNRPGR
jgi:hypothetical protein